MFPATFVAPQKTIRKVTLLATFWSAGILLKVTAAIGLPGAPITAPVLNEVPMSKKDPLATLYCQIAVVGPAAVRLRFKAGTDEYEI